MKIFIYTDGGCRNNPGIGAWSYVILDESENIINKDSYGSYYTTNNEMELMAIYSGVSYLQVLLRDTGVDVSEIIINSDSAYSINCLSVWGYNWIRNNITDKCNFDIIKNCIQKIEDIKSEFGTKVTFNKVKGHSGNKWNEYVDTELNKYMDSM